MPRKSPVRAKLSVRTLDALTVSEKAFDLFDSEVRGFHARVHPSGVITFALRYRDPAGGQPPRYHRLVLGSYGTLTPDGARAIAREKRAEVDKGLNPVRDDRLRKNAMTVDDAITVYTHHLTDTRSPRYASESARLLRTHCAPPGGKVEKGGKRGEGGNVRTSKTREEREESTIRARPRSAPATGARENWGPRPLASITRAEVLELHARMRPTPVLANRVAATLSALFTFASRQGWPGILTNPVMPRPHYKETSRGRVLTDAEAAQLGQALRDAETLGTPWQAIGIIRLAFLTGMRREEAATLRWDAIDIPHRRVVLAASKTGRSERPLGASTIALIESLRAMAPKRSAFVFPSPDDWKKPYQNTPKFWNRIRVAAKLPTLRLHDLRHDAATETGMRFPLAVLMALTGHVDASVASRYIHQHDDPIKRAADDVTQRRAAKLEASVPVEGVRKQVTRARSAS